jgi:hypothetical protein
VYSYHIGIKSDPVRRTCRYEYYCLLGISHLSCLNAGLGQLYSPIPSFDGDIPFLAILVSARPSGNESIGDP